MSADLPRVPNPIDEGQLYEKPLFSDPNVRMERRDLFDAVSEELERQRPIASQWIKEECMLGEFCFLSLFFFFAT
jgi:hypothetical protein